MMSFHNGVNVMGRRGDEHGGGGVMSMGRKGEGMGRRDDEHGEEG